MILKYYFIFIIWLQNQTNELTGWSSCSVFGSWVASGHLYVLLAPGCSGSRVSAATKYIRAPRRRKTSAALYWLCINQLLSRSGVSMSWWLLLAQPAGRQPLSLHTELGSFQAGSEQGQSKCCFGCSWLRSLQESHRLLKSGQLPCLPLGLLCSLRSLQRHTAALPCPWAGVSLRRQASLDSPLQFLCGGGSLSSLPTCTSIASFSLPRFLLHRTAVGVRCVPTICHRLMPALIPVVVSVEKQLQVCFSAVKKKTNFTIFLHHQYNLSTFLFWPTSQSNSDYIPCGRVTMVSLLRDDLESINDF